MKAKTLQGTSVEIYGLSGHNMVMVHVNGRVNVAQVNASSLIPVDVIPDELKDLHFYEEPKTEVVTEEVKEGI